MDANYEADARILAWLFFLALLAVGVCRLIAPRPSQAAFLPGKEPLIRDSAGTPLSICRILPPDGTGVLLLFRLQDPIPVLRAAMSRWKSIRENHTGPAVAVLITSREEGIQNIAEWFEMSPLLHMDPDTFYSRFRVSGLPVVLLLDAGRIVSSQVVLP